MLNALRNGLLKKLFFLIIPLSIFGCMIDEAPAWVDSHIKNSTSHSIKLLPYRCGMVDNERIVVIKPDVDTVVDRMSQPGKSFQPTYINNLSFFDSILVTFDDSIKIPHIRCDSTYTGSHKVPFSSKRSLMNINNWTKTYTSETKYALNGYYMFTFVEQDYLDAR